MRLHSLTCAVTMMTATLAIHATSIPWNGASYTDGSATISVTPFTANTFNGASGAATFGQVPGVPQAAILQVEVNGNFETVDQTGYGANGSLASLFGASTFSGGTITALRLIDQDSFGNQYNNPQFICTIYGGCIQNLTSETFSFSQVTPSSVTPEPASLALLGTGLLGVGGVVRKRFA